MLEHLGQTTEQYKCIIQEIYRICASGAVVHIVVPHPRHKVFISDPTHIRAIVPEQFYLLSKSHNEKTILEGQASSTLGLDWNVDFKVLNIAYIVEEPCRTDLENEVITQDEVLRDIEKHNGVCRDIKFDVVVVKD